MNAATRYAGPLTLDEAKTKLGLARLDNAVSHCDGPRENFEYRGLGLAASTNGQVGA